MISLYIILLRMKNSKTHNTNHINIQIFVSTHSKIQDLLVQVNTEAIIKMEK